MYLLNDVPTRPNAHTIQCIYKTVYLTTNHTFWCLQMNNKFEPWSLVAFLQKQNNDLIFTQLTESKIHE